MKTIEELLKNLARPEVLEFGLVTNRLPSVNIGGKFEPVDDEAPSTERLMQMLVAMGGSRYIDALTDKPVQWTTRLEGVGVIAVAAILRKDVVQARFTVAKRDSASGVPSTPSPRASMTAAHRPAAGPTPPALATGPNQAAPSPPVPPARGGQGPVSPSAPGASRRPSISALGPVPPATKRAWDDDDEPTLQTVLPPVKAPTPDPRPKPARHPGEVSRPDEEPNKPAAQATGLDEKSVPESAAEKARAEKTSPEKPGTEKTAPEKAPVEASPSEQPDEVAADKVAADKAAQEKAAQERATRLKAAQEKLVAAQRETAQREAAQREAEQRAAEQRAAEAAQDRAAQERATQELVRMREQRAAEERAARAPAPRPGSPLASGGRRISTPTSVDIVDIVDVDEATRPGVSTPESLAIHVDTDSVDNMVPISVDSAVLAAAAPHPALEREPVLAPSHERTRIDPSASIDAFVALAVAAKASDLHIIAGRPALLRIALDLVPRTQPIAPEQVERILKDVVPPRLRDVLDRDGACDFAIEHPAHGRFRVNASRQQTGFKLSLRIIPKDLPSVGALGLPDGIVKALAHERGLVLVTGMVSHGKSTTLAALVDHLNREIARHIVTIEEPLEYIHPRKKSLVSQREVGLHTRTKVGAIRATMQEDADVVVIGELDSAESIRGALAASESGRLVLAAMNAPSAAKSLSRVIDRFPVAEQGKVRAMLSSELRAVLGQRLLPSVDRTRLHAAFELISWSVPLHTLLRDGRMHELPALVHRGGRSIVRIEESVAELVRSQKVTPETAKPWVDVSSEVARPGSVRPSVPVNPGSNQARK